MDLETNNNNNNNNYNHNISVFEQRSLSSSTLPNLWVELKAFQDDYGYMVLVKKNSGDVDLRVYHGNEYHNESLLWRLHSINNLSVEDRGWISIGVPSSWLVPRELNPSGGQMRSRPLVSLRFEMVQTTDGTNNGIIHGTNFYRYLDVKIITPQGARGRGNYCSLLLNCSPSTSPSTSSSQSSSQSSFPTPLEDGCMFAFYPDTFPSLPPEDNELQTSTHHNEYDGYQRLYEYLNFVPSEQCPETHDFTDLIHRQRMTEGLNHAALLAEILKQMAHEFQVVEEIEEEERRNAGGPHQGRGSGMTMMTSDTSSSLDVDKLRLGPSSVLSNQNIPLLSLLVEHDSNGTDNMTQLASKSTVRAGTCIRVTPIIPKEALDEEKYPGLECKLLIWTSEKNKKWDMNKDNRLWRNHEQQPGDHSDAMKVADLEDSNPSVEITADEDKLRYMIMLAWNHDDAPSPVAKLFVFSVE